MSTAPITKGFPTPDERRQRNREEMTGVILDVALQVMQEQGVSSLNMNEVARRLKLRPQSLAEYFANKNAVYDALVARAVPALQDADDAATRDYPPGLDRIRAWFEHRIEWAENNPILYQLLFNASAPGWEPGPAYTDAARQALDRSRHFVADAIEGGIIDPRTSVEQATDLMLSIRHGIIAERLGKRGVIEPGRFDGVVDVLIRMIAVSWAPSAADPADASSGGNATA